MAPAVSNTYIGIDLGTSKSGFCLITPNPVDPKGALLAPQCCFQYPFEDAQYPKTRTALLYDKAADGKAVRPPVAWGAEAHVKYISLQAAEQSSYLYLENFKLGLAPAGGVAGRETVYDIAPMSSAGLTLLDVLSDYLERLVAYLKAHVTTALRTELNFSTARWALTVPAEWDAAAKQLMRSAALAAGIIDTRDSPALVLVHEPEAAALACQTRGGLADVREGDTFLVIDAGGGTIDLTWHRVVGHAGTGDDEGGGGGSGSGGLRLADATHRVGLTYGGSVMDRDFLEYVKETLGAAYDAWLRDPAAANELVKLLGNWQNVKHEFDGSEPEVVHNGEAYCGVRLPPLLLAKLPPQKKEEFEMIMEDLSVMPVREKLVRKIFNEVEQRVLEVVGRMKQQAVRDASAGTCTRVLLVGGMISNRYLVERLKAGLKELLPTATIDAPEYGYAAIVEGASLFAKDPTVITARRSPLTYGIRVAKLAEADSPSRSGKRCLDFFQPFVRRNEEVPVDYSHTQAFAPHSSGQRLVDFELYATVAEEPPKYCSQITDDPGQLATVTLKVPRHGGLLKSVFRACGSGRKEDYRIQASMTFGAAEIRFGARDLQRNRAVDTAVVFNAQRS